MRLRPITARESLSGLLVAPRACHAVCLSGRASALSGCHLRLLRYEGLLCLRRAFSLAAWLVGGGRTQKQVFHVLHRCAGSGSRGPLATAGVLALLPKRVERRLRRPHRGREAMQLEGFADTAMEEILSVATMHA